MQIKTKRLLLRPLTDEALAAVVAAETDPHMKQAYAEMLAGAMAHPKERLFYTSWEIAEKKGGPVGSLCLKGPAVNGAVEVGYGIDPAYAGHGYATEAVGAIMEWAYAQTGVYWITAETEPGNAASQRVLEKLGFAPTGEMGAEGPLYEKEKPAAAWQSYGIGLGLCFGVAFGTAMDQLAVGISLGLCIGVAIGIGLDAEDKKKRAACRAARKGTGGSGQAE